MNSGLSHHHSTSNPGSIPPDGALADDRGHDPFLALQLSLGILSSQRLPSVQEALQAVQVSNAESHFIAQSRTAIANILAGKDNRLLVIAGPCSLHDLGAAQRFADKLAELQTEVSSTMLLVMRGMFEKPRSSVGWKGYAHQPNVNGGYDMPKAVLELRGFFRNCARKGVPLAAEALDPALQLYFMDTLSYVTIGARTVESQLHRQLASLLKVPVGFKNPTSGNLKVAVDAVQSASTRQSMVTFDLSGAPVQAITEGNPFAHIILRGGAGRPNYHPADIIAARDILSERSRVVGKALLEAVVVDCSHDNSGGDFLRQALVFQSCIDALCAGERSSVQPLKGLMLEVNLLEGKQVLGSDSPDPDISVTDACIGIDTFRNIIGSAHERLLPRATSPIPGHSKLPH